MSKLISLAFATIFFLPCTNHGTERFAKYKAIEAYEVGPSILIMPSYSADCVFRTKLAINSGVKLATDSGLKLATYSGGKLATLRLSPERVANMAPETVAKMPESF